MNIPFQRLVAAPIVKAAIFIQRNRKICTSKNHFSNFSPKKNKINLESITKKYTHKDDFKIKKNINTMKILQGLKLFSNNQFQS